MFLIKPYYRHKIASNIYSRSILLKSSPKICLSGNSNIIICKKQLTTKTNIKTKSKYTFFKFGIALGLGGSILYATNDSFRNSTRHIALTADRVGVVALATIRCFKLYKDTLEAVYDSPNDRNKALSETHLKAANITLKALEKNG